MAKKKKALITFLLLITALYSVWDAIKGISQEFSIPIPILLFAILIIYLVWKEGEGD